MMRRAPQPANASTCIMTQRAKPVSPQTQKCLEEAAAIERALKQFLTENQPSGWFNRDYRYELDTATNDHGALSSAIAAQDFQACMLGLPRATIISR